MNLNLSKSTANCLANLLLMSSEFWRATMSFHHLETKVWVIWKAMRQMELAMAMQWSILVQEGLIWAQWPMKFLSRLSWAVKIITQRKLIETIFSTNNNTWILVQKKWHLGLSLVCLCQDHLKRENSAKSGKFTS